MISRGFDNAECEARTIRAQEKLARQDLAGLLLMTEPDIRYFTGFHTFVLAKPNKAMVLIRATDRKAHRHNSRDCRAYGTKLD